MKSVEFPECLGRPDLAGVVRVRSVDTERDYRQRYAGMIKTLSRKLGKPVNVADLIEDLRGRAASIKPNTFYQYSAVVMQELRDAFEQGDLSADRAKWLVDRMVPVGGTVVIGSLAPSGRTSADRRRHIKPQTVGSIVTAASVRRRPTFDNLADLFEFGVKTGTRPCELFGAKLEGRRLIICSAKFCEVNERGLGKYREIELLDDFDEYDLEGLQRLLSRLEKELSAVGGNRTRLVRRYGDALRVLRRDLPWASGITLRTTRSQFRANIARAGYSHAEQAAAMGHGSAETGSSNYGSTNKGWRPSGGRPIGVKQEVVDKVRPGGRAKAKIARNQPLKLTEVRDAFRSRKPK